MVRSAVLVLGLAATASAVTTVPLSKKARGVKGERPGSLGKKYGSKRTSQVTGANLGKSRSEHSHEHSKKTTLASTVDDDPTNATMTWEADSYIVDLEFGHDKCDGVTPRRPRACLCLSLSLF